MEESDSDSGCSDLPGSSRHVKTYHSADFSYIREMLFLILRLREPSQKI